MRFVSRPITTGGMCRRGQQPVSNEFRSGAVRGRVTAATGVVRSRF